MAMTLKRLVGIAIATDVFGGEITTDATAADPQHQNTENHAATNIASAGDPSPLAGRPDLGLNEMRGKTAAMSRRMMLLLMICLAAFVAAHIVGIVKLGASLPAPDATSLMLGAD